MRRRANWRRDDEGRTPPGEGAHGFEHADLLTVRAPKPTRILAATQDSKPIAGTRATFGEAKQMYAALGAAERVDLFEVNDKHGLSKPKREKAVEWMCQWLVGERRTVIEGELTLQPDKALQVTRTGQVLRDFEGEATVPALNLSRARRLASARRRFWREHSSQECLAEVRRLIGCRRELAKPTVAQVGEPVRREGYRIEKFVIRRADEVPVPALLFVPGGAEGRLPATLYVDGRGKAADAGPDGPMAALARQGRVVMAIDVRGTGETTDAWQLRARKRPVYPGDEYRSAMISMHIGRSLLGQRVEDVLAALDVLAARADVDPRRIGLVGVGRAGPVALHAAALDGRVAEVELRRSIASWIDDVVAKPLGENLIAHVVPAALETYDLPDLVRAMAPRKVASQSR